jgi:hypothetical protein
MHRATGIGAFLPTLVGIQHVASVHHVRLQYTPARVGIHHVPRPWTWTASPPLHLAQPPPSSLLSPFERLTLNDVNPSTLDHINDVNPSTSTRILANRSLAVGAGSARWRGGRGGSCWCQGHALAACPPHGCTSPPGCMASTSVLPCLGVMADLGSTRVSNSLWRHGRPQPRRGCGLAMGASRAGPSRVARPEFFKKIHLSHASKASLCITRGDLGRSRGPHAAVEQCPPTATPPCHFTSAGLLCLTSKTLMLLAANWKSPSAECRTAKGKVPDQRASARRWNWASCTGKAVRGRVAIQDGLKSDGF